MTNDEKPLIELIQALPPEARNEVRDFVEFLIAKQRRQRASQAQAKDWLKGFFERTAAAHHVPDRDTVEVEPALDELQSELPENSAL